jgi:uncharacterized membrane protein YoaK (UPF0700 family)
VLSERESKALRRIEQQLAVDDPGLAATLSPALPGRPARWPQRLITATLLLAVLCLAVGAVGAGLATALFAGALIWARRFLVSEAAPQHRRGWWRVGAD